MITDSTKNPAGRIKAEYGRLMAITTTDDLRREAILVVGTSGISPKNVAKFRATVTKETQLDRLRSYLTNFLLKADGLGVV